MLSSLKLKGMATVTMEDKKEMVPVVVVHNQVLMISIVDHGGFHKKVTLISTEKIMLAVVVSQALMISIRDHTGLHKKDI